MFHGKQFAGAGKAGLHFVGNEDDAVLVADFAQRFHEGLGHIIKAALALYRLDDDGRHAARIDIGLEQFVEHRQRFFLGNAMHFDRERHVEHIVHHRAKADFVGHDLAGQRHAHEGAAMERAGEGNDRLAAGGGTGDFYSIFDSFRTGGDKDRLLGKLARNSLVQAFGKADVVFVRDDLMAGVGEMIELVFDGCNHLRDGGGRC